MTDRTTFTGIPVTNSEGVEKYFDFEVGEEGGGPPICSHYYGRLPADFR